MDESLVQPKEREVSGRLARVYEGGKGVSLLLIHGAWGGASLHFSRVWDDLAQSYRVIAPDLPGLGQVDAPARASVSGYARWLVNLLEVLGVERAFFIGNSFGASVAWSLAGRYPELCAGLVLINGFPMPKTPTPLHWLSNNPVGEALMRATLRMTAFHPNALRRAFVNEDNVPDGLRAMLAQRGSLLVPNCAKLVIAGDGSPEPKVSPLLLWGAEDRLIGTSAADARKHHASIPGSTLKLIPNAGHFPQIEAPDAFVAEVQAFVG
jgi:pimeloyl-ACP methyl ester carboxylesterase